MIKLELTVFMSTGKVKHTSVNVKIRIKSVTLIIE